MGANEPQAGESPAPLRFLPPPTGAWYWRQGMPPLRKPRQLWKSCAATTGIPFMSMCGSAATYQRKLRI